MSENVGSSESAVEETASSPPVESAQPESVSPPKKDGKKKKMLIMVVAIIVVAALIGTAVYVMVIAGPKLKAEMSPSPIPDVAAGTSVTISIEVTSGGDDVTDDATLSWSVDPASLGSFNVYAQPTVIFSAGDVAGTGTIICEVEYDGKTIVAEEDITVEPPFLDSVSIIPSSKSLDLDEEWMFNATAYDSVGDAVTGATFAWTVTGIDAADYTLSATTGASVTFSASVQGVATLGVTATKDGDSVSGSATVSVGTNFTRSVDYYWDDLFNHPLGEWYDIRESTSNEWIVNNEYPYLYIWEGPPAGNIWIYTFMRMDMDAQNLTEVNMMENPEFLPYFSDETVARGGTAVLDWYLNYVTMDECEGKLTGPQMAWYDGWYVAWNGTVLLDEDAAKSVLGVTSTEFDDFTTWWNINGAQIETDWEDWLMYEAGPERLAIFNMYEWDLQFVWFDMVAAKPDADHIELTFDTISWGMEALMTRWMREAWMPTEWYFEDMNFDATIGPERSDIVVDTAIQYAVYAYEDTLDSKPCWCWEALMQDYVPSPSELYPDSLFELYEPFTYLNWAPGSAWYGEEMPYDYAPGAWNMSEGETLTIEWPAGEQMFFVHSPDYDGETLVPDTRQVFDEMTVRYAEPMPSDTDTCEIDLANRQIIYTGPFDMWTWSRDQTAHDWLADEWDRLEILPYGIPFVEIVTATEDEGLDIEVEVLTDPVEVGEPATVSVSVVTEITRTVVEDYAGTVTFETDDTSAVLPADYTFVPATDMGVHEFTVTFNTVDPVSHDATYYLTVSDVDDSLVSGTASDIQVVEFPRIASFDVVFTSVDPVIATEPTDITVTAMNQWDEVFTTYEGTVEFSSDDTGATLPAPTAFTAGMSGVQSFEVTFSADGELEVNVSDTVVTDAYGVASVTVMPEPGPSYFVLSSVSDPAEVDVTESMRVTVYDQYDRPYTGYDGTVTFETNRSSDVTLPMDTDFSLGTAYVDVDITFHYADAIAGTYYMVWCNDSTDSSLTGDLSVWVVGDVYADHFVVSGIEDMWENNYSGVTVTVIDNLGTTYENYDGTITFSSNASSGDELPDDYTFDPDTDSGVKAFPLSVSFDLPGTYNVTVEEFGNPTLRGSQEDIVIEELYVDSLEISGPDCVEQDELFSVTVTAYHQHSEVYEEYGGTVDFTTSDGSGLEQLPSSYQFQPADEGVHQFDDLSLNEIGSQTITVTDSGASISDVLSLEVIPPILSDITWRVYDMLGETPGEWWDVRWGSNWNTEAFLTTDAGNVTYMYNAEGNEPNGNDDRGLIYAPYRWNVSGIYLPNADVHEPVFMPVFGTGPVVGAEATLDVYCQYANTDYWTSYVIPTWSTNPDWEDAYGLDLLLPVPSGSNDGYYTGTAMNVTLNREAAEEWLGMGQSEDPDTWWTANGAGYITDWRAWIYEQGNDIFDIYCGYEWPYVDVGTFMDLTGDETQVELRIFHITWGYEVLLTRWLLDTGLSVNQPYMEDIKMDVDFREDDIDFDLDAVAQWGMHCVKANESAVGNDAPCAWVWEPIGIDYIGSFSSHPSYYDPYLTLTYKSWNCGDPKYTQEIPYEACPWNFTLPEYGRLVLEVPDYDATGYYAETMPSDAMRDLWDGDSTAYDNIRYAGAMDLGWYDLNGHADFTYEDGVMTINGPFEFTNDVRDGSLYHGAPWIEFTVAPPTKAAVASAAPTVGVVAEEPAAASPSAASASASLVTELVSLMAVVFAVMLAIAALAVGVVRRPAVY